MSLSFIIYMPRLRRNEYVRKVSPKLKHISQRKKITLRPRLLIPTMSIKSGVTFTDNFDVEVYLSNIQTEFTRRAKIYDKTGFTFPDHLTFVQDLTERYPPEYPMLDVACGTGLICCALGNEGKGVFGIDLTAAMLEEAKTKYPLGDFVQGRAEKLPFDDCSFNSVYICSALPYFVDVNQALKEAWRVLNPGGFLAYQAVSQNSYVIGVVLREAVVQIFGDQADKIFVSPNAFSDGISENEQLVMNAGFGQFEISNRRFENSLTIQQGIEYWESIICKNPLTKQVTLLEQGVKEKVRNAYLHALSKRADQNGRIQDTIVSWYVRGFKVIQ